MFWLGRSSPGISIQEILRSQERLFCTFFKISGKGPVTLLRQYRTSVCQRMKNINHTPVYADIR
jgi:hypothetical protein